MPPPHTLEVEPLQIVAEEPVGEAQPVTTASSADAVTFADRGSSADRGKLIYECAIDEIPWDSLDHAEGMLMTLLDGKRTLDALVEICESDRAELQRMLDSLVKRSLVIRKG